MQCELTGFDWQIKVGIESQYKLFVSTELITINLLNNDKYKLF